MYVTELTRDQLIELKQQYLVRLADEGTFSEVLNTDHDAPSYEELAAADEIVPDDVIYHEEEGTCFVNDDFFCSCSI